MMRVQQVPHSGCLRLSLLGGFAATDPDGREIEISAKKGRALLAVAALSPAGSCSRARLANLLWSDRGDDQARGSLRQTLALLRKELSRITSGVLQSSEDRVTIDLHAATVDAVEFQKLAKSTDRDDLRRAAALYVGDFLLDLSIQDQAFDEWLTAERARVKELAISALDRLAALEAGKERVDVAKRLLDLDPFREASHGALMEAYFLDGERQQALRHYEQCQRFFESEIGTKPGPEIEHLRSRILSETEAPSAHIKESIVQSGANTTSIAVLSFEDLSGSESKAHLADGLAEDLIIELSRYRHLRVVSRHSSFAFQGQHRKIEDIAAELGAEFVVEGSIRINGQRLRVSFQLADGETGKQVVAERYDRDFDNIMEVLDDIVSAIVARLTFNLDAAAGSHRLHPTVSGLAYGKFLKARGMWQTGDEKGARTLLHEAIAIDPNYAQALAYLAFFYSLAVYTRSLRMDSDELIRRTRDLGQRAIAADPDDPFVLQRVAMALCCIGDLDLAQRYAEAAAARNPSDIEVLLTQGNVMLCRGDVAKAREFVERACASEPRLPPGYWISLAECRYLSQDYLGAVRALETIVNPSDYVQSLKAASFAQAGDTAAAKGLVHSLKDRFDLADFVRRYVTPYAKPEHKESWIQGFRMAGMAV
jgi:TolB-like protein/Tfp pilus assembly protein PilF